MAIDSSLDLSALGLRSATDAQSQATKKSELGQEDFLRLMIEQFRHQDPFKPLESGEFLGQLAQFSSVAGLAELKQSFADLSASLTSNQTLQASSLLGRQVLVAGDSADLAAEGSLTGVVDLPASAQSVIVQVTNANGAVVQKVYLNAPAAGLNEFTWDGTMSDGSRAPAGTYKFVATAVNGTETDAVSVLTSATVESVTLGAGQTGLTLSVTGLGEIPFSSVRQIR